MPGPWSLARRRSPKIPRKGEGPRPQRPIIDTSQGLVAKALAAGSTPRKLATASTRSWHYRSGPVSPPGPLAFFGPGYADLDGVSAGRSAQSAAGAAGGLPLPRPERRRAVRRQGEVLAAAGALVLPAERRYPHRDPAAPGAGRRRRGDRHPERGRGASSGAEPREAAPAAVQRPAARRQVLPVHRRHGRGRVPARYVHARAPPPGSRLLRAVREREEGARDPRRPQPGLPVPSVRGAEAGPPLRDPVSRLPHRPLPGAVRRLRVERGLSRDHRPGDRIPLRRDGADPAAARGEDARGRLR